MGAPRLSTGLNEVLAAAITFAKTSKGFIKRLKTMLALSAIRARLDKPALQALAGFAIVFWGLRFWYWLSIHEPPFSDMADYANVGENIARRFFFAVNDDLYAYYTPVTPSFIAIAKIVGGAHEMMVFRLMIAGLLFVSTIALAYELATLTANRWIGAGVLAVVSLSKPSIFWGYKYCTETVSEMLIIAALALMLHTIRRNNKWSALAAGSAGAMLFLNRPQFLPGVLLLAPLLSTHVRAWLERLGRTSSTLTTRVTAPAKVTIASAARKPLAAFCLGVFLIWTPWIARNYAHYGAFIPLGTSGGEAIYWEYAGAPIRVGRYDTLPQVTGTFSEEERRKLLAAPTDLERQARATAMANAWLTANAPDLPRLVWWRLKHFAAYNGASGLTTVDRNLLFQAPDPRFNNPLPPVRFVNLLLLDKTPWACIFALVGMFALGLRNRAAGLASAALIAAPWGMAALVIGYERAVESLITPLLMLALYGLVVCAQRLSPGATPIDG